MTVMSCGNCDGYIEDNIFGTPCKKCGWKVGDGIAVTGVITTVPQQLPPMDEELAWILGRPNFTLAGIAGRLRELGHEIKKRSEDEQAAVLYWMINLYLQHGANWRAEAEKTLAA